MILEFILKYFLSSFGEQFEPIIKLFEQNGFDIKQTLKNAKPEDFAPLLRLLIKPSLTNPINLSVEPDKTTPIENFADKEIVSTLNCFFSR